MAPSIAVLVSIGRNPVSGRARRADGDARALAMALDLAGDAADLDVVHAGNPDAPVLRDYLGTGAPRLTVLPVAKGADPAPALLAHLRRTRPELVLSGVRAEAGEAAGFLPYWLASRLSMPLLPEVVEIARDGEGWRALLTAPGGRRRRIRASGAILATVGGGAPAARLAALGPARRGEILIAQTDGDAVAFVEDRSIGPARQRPRRLTAAAGAKAATGPLVGVTPEEAALAIAEFLSARGFLGR